MLSNSFFTVCFLLLLISASSHAKERELGVAVDPLKIELKPNHMTYFTVSNDTENDYIVTTKIISRSTIKDTAIEPKILVNPPIRLLKKRDKAQMGVVFLPGRYQPTPRPQFYLSISFVPRIPDDYKLTYIPVILVQQVPLSFEYSDKTA
ncbi:TPA: molecular chaperone [Escherichia coli]|nr:molecular chaperone [Escherichia coli]HAZ3680324.1 molecular chaperone [Escherichia coli]HAZ3906455.1 molecular chaperone [Escherichia coli]HBA7074209.1 molecular chaperone [Escherichia coli]HBA7189001.1 molecular chaperone [Escherichia coli]